MRWKEHVVISKKTKFQHTIQKETEIVIFLKVPFFLKINQKKGMGSTLYRPTAKS